MNLKIVQLNIYKGKFLHEAIDFLKKEDADLVTLQEVTVGEVSFFEDKSVNIFDLLENKLNLNGVFHSDLEISDDKNSALGNAVLSKFPIVESKVVVFNTFRALSFSEFSNNVDDVWASISRHMLDAVVEIDGFRVHAISVHGRRTAPPVDDEENLRQADLIVEYIKSLGNEPFVMGGDFNMPLGSLVIDKISAVSENLMTPSSASQTLNPRIHELGNKGYLVDFIFTSKNFRLKKIDVPQVDISDHLPILALLEL